MITMKVKSCTWAGHCGKRSVQSTPHCTPARKFADTMSRAHESGSDSGARRRQEAMQKERAKVTAVAHRNHTAPRPISPIWMSTPSVSSAPKYEYAVADGANLYSSSTWRARSLGWGHPPPAAGPPVSLSFADMG